MPFSSLTSENHQDIIQSLNDYSTQLRQCIEQGEWESLVSVLTQRQAYFEEIFEQQDQLDLLSKKVIIQQILSEDNELVGIVIEQKNQVENERLNLARSRQAVKAYQ